MCHYVALKRFCMTDYICTCRNIDRLSYFFASLIKSQLTLSNSNKRFNTL